MPFDPLVTFTPGPGQLADVGDPELIINSAAGRPVWVFAGPHKLPEWTEGITIEPYIIHYPDENKIQFFPDGIPDAEITIYATTTEIPVPADPPIDIT